MTEQVRAIRLRPTLSTVLDSATNSDGEIFFDSNNQTLRIFDNGTGALVATRTWTTSSISTAIAAIPAVDLTGLATETYVDDAIAAIPAVDLTGLATETYVGTAISNLIDTAPTTLDTLNELAAALGDDANFAGTVTTSLGLKAPLESPVFTGTVTIPLSTEVVTPPFHPAHLAPAAIVEYRSSDDPFVGSTGTVTDTRGVVYHTIDDSAGAANWTANFSSLLLPTTAWSSKSFAIVCSQGSTNAWLPTAVQIGGAAQTIQWQGNIPPTGTVNGVDIISFTFIRRASDWLVLGSGTSYS
jgi:hypothetical protein